MKSLPHRAMIWAVATATTMPVPGVVMAQDAAGATPGSSPQGTVPAQSAAEAPLRQEEL